MVFRGSRSPAARRSGAGACRAWLLCACACVLLGVVSSTTIRVESETLECFRENVPHESMLFGNFEVLSGGDLDINVQVKQAGSGSSVYESRGHRSDRFGEKVQPGKYELCFSSVGLGGDARSVSFNYYFGEGFSHQEIARKDHLDPLLSDVTSLSNVLIQLKEEQDFFRGREKVHFESIEGTYKRIFWVSVIETFVILAVSAFQIYVLTRFLEVKSYI